MFRIISLLPSATEILSNLNLLRFLVGRSHECDFPVSIQHLPVLTKPRIHFQTSSQVNTDVSRALSSCSIDDDLSLYEIDWKMISALNPTHILTQDICSVCSVSDRQVQRGLAYLESTNGVRPKVLSLNPMDLWDVFEDVKMVAREFNTDCTPFLDSLHSRIRNVELSSLKLESHPKVLFLEWLDPPYFGGHWTPQLIRLAGGSHPLNEAVTVDGRLRGAPKSVAIETAEILKTHFDIVIMCFCGLDLDMTEKELARMYHEHGGSPWWTHFVDQNVPVYLVDGNQMFNRPGPRLVDALEFLGAVLTATKPKSTFPFEQLRLSHILGKYPSASPNFIEIEELHDLAVTKSEDTYVDPATGYRVLTRKFLQDRGTCCGNGCRHCPYGHMNVKNAAKQSNIIKEIVIANKGNQYKKSHSDHISVLFWSGGKDSYLAYRKFKRDHPSANLLLLTTFGKQTQRVSIQNIHIRDVLKQAKGVGEAICVVPLAPHSDYQQTMAEAFQLIQEQTGLNVNELVFGDLHLQDILGWRKQAFAAYKVSTPLFGMSYDILLDELWKAKTEEDLIILVCATEVDSVKIGDSYDKRFLETLDPIIDQMGENGEFHTHVIFPQD